MADGPLRGIKVVELGLWVAAPAAAAVLADWGADVVKIEPPAGGDPLRGLAATGLVPANLDVNPVFLLDNRGKRSVALDITRPGAIDVIHRLLEDADVFVTNVRTRALERAGLTYAQLRERHPRLIHASLTGYGTEGPEADRAAFDYAAFWARAGIMASLGEPEGPPPNQRPGMGDHATAFGMAGAISAALLARERTGEGQEVRFSLFRSGIWFHSGDIQVALTAGVGYRPAGRRRAPNPLFNNYRVKGGRWIQLIMLQPDRHWADFCTAIEREDLRNDPRFETVVERREHGEALVDLLDEILITKTVDEWGEIFDRNGVFWGRVQTVSEVVGDQQARAAGAFHPVELPSGATTDVVRSPVDFVGSETNPRGPAPELGQSTEEVLLEAGYSWEEIGELKERGVIG